MILIHEQTRLKKVSHYVSKTYRGYKIRLWSFSRLDMYCVFVCVCWTVENPAHCDFVKLRNMLVRTHMQDLKDVTRETHYENYRAQCIQSMTRMVVKERNRKYAVTTQAAEAVFSLFISFCFEQQWPQKVFGNLSHIRYLHFAFIQCLSKAQGNQRINTQYNTPSTNHWKYISNDVFNW